MDGNLLRQRPYNCGVKRYCEGFRRLYVCLYLINVEKMQNDQIVIYKTENGETVIDVKVDDNTIWLTLNQLSELFGKNKSTMSRHLNNIYTQEELTKEATVAKNTTVQIKANRHIERNI